MQQRERIKFQCYNCPYTYSLTKFLEKDEKPSLFVTCPFCGAQAKVDLTQFRATSTLVMMGGDDNAETTHTHFVLPDVVQTEPIK